MSLCACVCVYVMQPVDSAELSCSVRALQQDLEELKSVNASLRKENHSLREQLNTARNGKIRVIMLLVKTTFYTSHS